MIRRTLHRQAPEARDVHPSSRSSAPSRSISARIAAVEHKGFSGFWLPLDPPDPHETEVETRIEHAAAVYVGIWHNGVGGCPMPRTAKVFMTNRSQAVRLPKDYQFSTAEVFIRKEGDDVILSPRPRDWRAYLETAPVASDAFMADVEDLPVQERES
jgi:antitoxin VapB